MSDIETILKQYATNILDAIVAYPAELRVDVSTDEQGTLVSVRVNKADMGVVIGKDGQTAKSIRTLVRIVGSKYDVRATVRIVEPE